MNIKVPILEEEETFKNEMKKKKMRVLFYYTFYILTSKCYCTIKGLYINLRINMTIVNVHFN